MDLQKKEVRDIIIKNTNKHRPDLKCKELKNHFRFKQLGNCIFHALNRFSPSTTKIRNIIKKVQKKILDFIETDLQKELKIKVTYSNVIEHIDCITYWDYKNKSQVSFYVYNPDKGYSERKTLTSRSNKSCTRENTSTLLPLFKHSVDGIMLRVTILNCDFDVVGLHDCQMCHPNNVDMLIQNWKKAICYVLGNGKKTNKEFIEDVWLNPTLEYLKSHLEKDKHEEAFNKITNIKQFWDLKWKRSKLEKIIDISDVESS